MIKRIVSVVSVLIVSFLAVIGILFDFQAASGGLTRWGSAALVATVVAGIAALGLEVLSFSEERRDQRAQKRREEAQDRALRQIQISIASQDHPLVPFRLFYTLRHQTSDGELDRYFSGVKGYKSMASNEVLRMVGAGRLSETPFNMEEESPERSHCELVEQEILEAAKQESKSRDTIVKIPGRFCVEIFLEGSSDDVREPDVVLESAYEAGWRQGSISAVRLYDRVIYQDGTFVDWKIRCQEDRSYSTTELRGSKIRITADFWNCSEKHAPSFANLHLYFGQAPISLLFLKSDDLGRDRHRVYRRNPLEGTMELRGDLAMELLRTLAVQLEILLTDQIFSNQLRRYAA